MKPRPEDYPDYWEYEQAMYKHLWGQLWLLVVVGIGALLVGLAAVLPALPS